MPGLGTHAYQVQTAQTCFRTCAHSHRHLHWLKEEEVDGGGHSHHARGPGLWAERGHMMHVMGHTCKFAFLRHLNNATRNLGLSYPEVWTSLPACRPSPAA